jgi:hypothetical protein
MKAQTGSGLGHGGQQKYFFASMSGFTACRRYDAGPRDFGRPFFGLCRSWSDRATETA